MNLPYPNADSNTGSFIRFGGSGTDITLNFVAEVGYSRVQFVWRYGFSVRLSLNYDVTSAQPDGLLRADWDGTTARILWNGEEVASGAPSGGLPVSGAANAFFDIPGTYVQTPRIFGVAYAQRMLPEEFGLRDFWGEVFVQDDTPIWFPVAAGGGSVALSASGAAQASGSASLAAGIALAGVGVALAGGSAAAAVALPLSAAGIATAAGSATGAISVTLSASALATAAGQAGLDVAAALAAAGSAQAGGSATLSGGAEGAISASGAAQAGGAAVLSILVTLAAAGTAQAGGSATLSGGPEGALAASGAAQAGGSATATVAIALTAAGLAQAIGSGQLTLSIPLSAIGFATSGGTATLIDINLVRVLAAPRAARPPRVQSGRRAPNLSASRRSWR